MQVVGAVVVGEVKMMMVVIDASNYDKGIDQNMYICSFLHFLFSIFTLYCFINYAKEVKIITYHEIIIN